MATTEAATRTRIARRETYILLAYCLLVFGGLAGATGLFWWACCNC